MKYLVVITSSPLVVSGRSDVAAGKGEGAKSAVIMVWRKSACNVEDTRTLTESLCGDYIQARRRAKLPRKLQSYAFSVALQSPANLSSLLSWQSRVMNEVLTWRGMFSLS